MFTPTDYNSKAPIPNPHPGTPPSYKVPLVVKIVKETERAYLIALADRPSGTAWIPKSAITIPTYATAWHRANGFDTSMRVGLFLEKRAALVAGNGNEAKAEEEVRT